MGICRDSVETALEEDAPGLLQVFCMVTMYYFEVMTMTFFLTFTALFLEQILLDKGITVEEIKLYGDVENDEALPCSSEDSFEELETIITKV